MKIGIIGAGALGLMLATLLEKNKIEYEIYNKGKVGRKILASGNGKCNIANNMISDPSYPNNFFAKELVISHQKQLFSYFDELNIYTKADKEGRMYPISESSLSVLNILLKHINQNKIIDAEIISISKKNNKYYFNNIYGPFDKIIIASGSPAAFKKPYPSISYINDLNIKFNDFKPSLVGLKTKLKIKQISGVRQKVIVDLYQDKNLIHSEYGEIIFKDDGVSGICVMNISSYFQGLNNKNNCSLIVDLSPNFDADNLESVLQPKLFEYVKANKIDYHKFVLPITGTYDMEFAQVAKGGIDLSELNNNLTLKKDNNIYAGGEIVDFDGVCGGFNLMLAFTSALAIFNDLYEIRNKKS